jgi:hypothetical protein
MEGGIGSHNTESCLKIGPVVGSAKLQGRYLDM